MNAPGVNDFINRLYDLGFKQHIFCDSLWEHTTISRAVGITHYGLSLYYKNRQDIIYIREEDYSPDIFDRIILNYEKIIHRNKNKEILYHIDQFFKE